MNRKIELSRKSQEDETKANAQAFHDNRVTCDEKVGLEGGESDSLVKEQQLAKILYF